MPEPDHTQLVSAETGERPPDELIASYFAIVPEWILAEPGDVVKLYALLDRAANKRRTLWPGQAELAEKMQCSDRQVRRHLTRLREIGALEVVKRRYNGTTIHVLHKDPPGHRSPQRPDTGVLTDRTGESGLSGQPSPPNQSQLERAKEPKPSLSRDKDFDTFWSIYPRREAKKAALDAFKAAVKRAQPEQIIAGAQRYRDDPNRESVYTKHAATWLRADCWDDDPLPPRPKNGNTRPTYKTPPIDDDRTGGSRVLRSEDL